MKKYIGYEILLDGKWRYLVSITLTGGILFVCVDDCAYSDYYVNMSGLYEVEDVRHHLPPSFKKGDKVLYRNDVLTIEDVISDNNEKSPRRHAYYLEGLGCSYYQYELTPYIEEENTRTVDDIFASLSEADKQLMREKLK